MLSSFLFEIKDHRREQGKRYELGYILMFSILAILSGATSYRKIASFIANHYSLLDELFELKWKRKPAYTTIREIIRETDGTELEKSFRTYSAQLASGEQSRWHIAIDGKVLRGSFDHFADQKALQLLSAFLSDNQIILAHEEIEAKTNEIPAAQELLEKLGLTGCLFTFDAMHCQEETLRVAQETGNDVIVQVKANQETLLNDCQTIAATQTPDAIYQEPFNKTRNRIESRKVECFFAPTLTHADKWDAVEAIVKVERFRQSFDTKSKTWKDAHETALYISTTTLEAQEFCHVIRQHWGTENRNHHVRDVTLREDASRIRANPAIFARLRSFALNILRRNHVSNVSQTLFDNCMNIHNVLNYVGVL